MHRISKIRYSIIKSATAKTIRDIDLEFIGSIALCTIFIVSLWLLSL